MVLQHCYVAIPRTVLVRASTSAFLAAAPQSKLLRYTMNLVQQNPPNPTTSSMYSTFMCMHIMECYKPSLVSSRASQRIVDSPTNTYLFSKLSAKYLWQIISLQRTMCTIKSDNKICWSCKKKIGEELFFCDICKIIQPPLTELSYFEVFGCAETYVLDAKSLTNRYRELQSMIHPDKFSNSNEAEKHYSAEQSSLINKAYNTLLDPLSRAIYLLSIKSIEIGESNTMDEKEFLMEIMEINERLSDVKSKEELDDMRASNSDSIEDCIACLTEAFQSDNLHAAKKHTIKLQYYRNIFAAIKEKIMELGN